MVLRVGGGTTHASSPPAKSALFALRGTSALNLKMFPAPGVPTGGATDEGEENADVAVPNSAVLRRVEYGDESGAADPEGAVGAARSKRSRLEPARLGMNRQL